MNYYSLFMKETIQIRYLLTWFVWFDSRFGCDVSEWDGPAPWLVMQSRNRFRRDRQWTSGFMDLRCKRYQRQIFLLSQPQSCEPSRTLHRASQPVCCSRALLWMDSIPAAFSPRRSFFAVSEIEISANDFLYYNNFARFWSVSANVE